jgi:hypothetical protein
MYCPRCGLKQPVEHRFCSSCGTKLPRGVLGPRPKVTQWFWAMPVAPGDPPQSALRVSCYLEEYQLESGGQTVTVPRDHVRLSIWVDDQAVCAVSIPNHEAERLVEFLHSWLPGTADAAGPPGTTGIAEASRSASVSGREGLDRTLP